MSETQKVYGHKLEREATDMALLRTYLAEIQTIMAKYSLSQFEAYLYWRVEKGYL